MSTKYAFALVALCCGACGGEPTAQEHFESQVLPIVEQRCAATVCHGVGPNSEASGDVTDWDLLFYAVDDDGRVLDVEAAYITTKRAINTAEAAAFSSLLRKPLGVGFGGSPHYGRTSFSGTDDPAYQAMHDWIEMESGGGESPEPFNELEQFFVDEVQPVLVEATCMTSRCHGPTAGGTPYHLDIGYQGEFSIEATRHNYDATMRMVSLDGYPMQSRLLRKSQPLFAGGINHKGINTDFYASNPGGGVPAIVDWICRERIARVGVACNPPEQPVVRGIVFVQGPVAARDAFDLDAFVPGRDLFLAKIVDNSLQPSELVNLTASLHADPVDIRDPAVSSDGSKVLFSLRTDAQSGHHIWMLDLATKEATQLTFGNGRLPSGGLATDRDPTWGPEGDVWFVSTRADELADRGRLDAEIYSLTPGSEKARRWTYSPHIERKLVFFSKGEEAGGEVSFSALREAFSEQRRAHIFRFPPDMSSDYHQHFGVTPVQDFFYDMRELPDGRYATTVGKLDDVWRAGSIAIIDRNFGPEINKQAESQESALEFYMPPMTILDADDPGAYRDVAVLPDGRLLVAHHPTPIDLADSAASFESRIEVLQIEEGFDLSGPHLAARSVLIEIPGQTLTDPEPVFYREPLREDLPIFEPDDSGVGVLLHNGLPIIDALLSNLAPSGLKAPRTDMRFVRLIEPISRDPARYVTTPPTENRAGIEGATTASLGGNSPERILAELPLAEDGSFQVAIPEGVVFRIQPLDGERQAVGAVHNRWFYMLAGQKLVQGLSVAAGLDRYGGRCAACHGDHNGVGTTPPGLPSADAITSASFTLSRFERQNPHRPIKPPLAGEATHIEVDFVRDVQPILTQNCATEDCHMGSSPAASLSLSAEPTTWYNDAYESLLAPGVGSVGGKAYVDQTRSRAANSYLIEKLRGQELHAPRALDTPGSTHPVDGLTEEELLVLSRWIDLGASFVGRE